MENRIRNPILGLFESYSVSISRYIMPHEVKEEFNIFDYLSDTVEKVRKLLSSALNMQLEAKVAEIIEAKDYKISAIVVFDNISIAPFTVTINVYIIRHIRGGG